MESKESYLIGKGEEAFNFDHELEKVEKHLNKFFAKKEKKLDCKPTPETRLC